MTSLLRARRLALLLALGGALALGAWWLAGAEPGAAIEPDVLGATRSDARPALPVADGPVASVPDASPPAAQDAAAAAAVLRVEVVDAGGQPLADIPVVLTLVHGSDPPRVLARAHTSPRAEPATLAVPAELFGDDWRAGGALRYAVAVDLPLDRAPRAELSSRPDRGALFRLALPPELAGWCRPLRVRVVSHAGDAVAGVPVSLAVRRELSPPTEQTVAGDTSRAPDGLALLPVDELWTVWGNARRLQLDLSLAARCALPFEPAVAVQLDPAGPAPDVVDLVLPPAGWIELLVERLPSNAPAQASWRRADRTDATRFAAVGRGAATGADDAAARGDAGRDGRAGRDGAAVAGEALRIGPLGLGWLVEVTVRDPAREGAATTVELAGPTRDGEVVAATVRLDPAPAALRIAGTVVGPAGTAWAGRPCVVALQSARASVDAHEAGDRALAGDFTRTDAGGAFRTELPLTAAAAALLARGELALVVSNVKDMPGDPALVARAVLAAPATSGATIDVGALTLSDASAATGERAGAGPPIEPVELALRRAGRVEGRVLVDADVPLDALRVTLVGGDLPRVLSLADFAGAFRFESLAPGEHDLTVGLHGSDWSLARVDGILVQAGQTAADPRLASIDLRGAVRRLVLELVADGRPVSSRNIAVVDEAGRGTRELVSAGDGRLVLLVPAALDRFVVRVPGHAPAPVAWQPAPAVVVLERD